jgi:hypothetical protein
MKPSVGRVVHYLGRGNSDASTELFCQAAIITEVSTPPFDAAVKLTVFAPDEKARFVNASLDETEDRKGGTWHWPERVAE